MQTPLSRRFPISPFKTILILDPSAPVRRLMQINLQRQLKCTVIEAGNLPELLAVLQRETIDLTVRAVSFTEEEEIYLRRANIKMLALKYAGHLSRIRGV